MVSILIYTCITDDRFDIVDVMLLVYIDWTGKRTYLGRATKAPALSELRSEYTLTND